jgi:RNase P subunit RPR2
MEQLMRIGVGTLTNGELGSIELPKESQDLCCPQCGTLLGDRGQCSAQFLEWPNENQVNVLRMIVNCRSCGCIDKEPMFRKTWEFMYPDRI